MSLLLILFGILVLGANVWYLLRVDHALKPIFVVTTTLVSFHLTLLVYIYLSQ